MKISSKIKRKLRNRKKLKDVKNNRYRVSINKSLKNLSAQIIDDKNNNQKKMINFLKLEFSFMLTK